MLRLMPVLLSFLLLASCTSRTPVVDAVYIDSLITRYQPPAQLKVVEADLAFWRARVDSLPFDLTNSQKWANALTERFHILGDVDDILRADSIYNGLSNFYKGREPGLLLALASIKTSRHQFQEAKSFVDSAAGLGAMRYAVTLAQFDAEFELGNTKQADLLLRSVLGREEYGYQFRLAKLAHYEGDTDSAYACMIRAAGLTENLQLKAIALSNAADLLLHVGKVEEAAELYRNCIRLNGADFHSMAGLGRIALLHDRNPQLALRIYSFVAGKHHSPEMLWKMAQAAETFDTVAAKRYALQFVQAANQPRYGNMYNKYLVDAYTSILQEPAKALAVAQREQANRNTPQTGAWLAWAEVANSRNTEALDVYRQRVSGKPLETLELFWMGRLMQQCGKGYNAKEFFKAADKNRYDLSPAQIKQLDKELD